MNYQEILNLAHKEGMIAGNNAIPTPIVIHEVDVFNTPVPNSQKYYVSEGACGFAWVWIKGNTKFGRWAKKSGIARSSYPTGLQISCMEFNQSVTRKAAYVEAYAKVLNDHGITCYADSRLD